MSSLAIGTAGLTARDAVALLKLRIDALVVATSLAAAAAAGVREPATLAVLAVACLSASAGASAINHYLDRALDARMARTRRRPIPSGRLARPESALRLGIALILASQASAAVLGALPALYLLAGALTYAVVYTWWLKPRTPYSIVLGGAAGSFAALAGWETGGTTWAPAPLLLAAVLFLWTPSHFWSLAIALEEDYRRAGLPMLSVVAGAARTAQAVWLNTLALVACSLALAAFLPWPYAAVAAPAGAWFLREMGALRREPTVPRARRAFKLSGAYLLCLLAGVALAAAA